MDEKQLFEAALGLQPPWRVTKVSLSTSTRELEIHLDFDRGALFPCPECADRQARAYDTKTTTWRHLDFFQYKTILKARHPRVQCEACGVHRVTVPWARPEAGFTFLFEAMVMALAPHMPVAAIARHVDEHDTRIWRILHHHIEDARSRLDLSDVTRVGIDETSSRKRHTYVSLFVDLEKRRVMFGTSGRDAATVAAFVHDLEEHGGSADRIEEVCMDLSPSFKSGVSKHLPHASVTWDRFHIMKAMNHAVDEVRRQERQKEIGLKRSRYLWLRRESRLTENQRERVAALSKAYPKTGRAHRIKEVLVGFWEKEPDEAAAYLEKWYSWAIRSRLDPVKDVARSIRKNWPAVTRWHQSRIDNGLLEGINSLVQAAKAKARGYRSDRNLLAMTYLIAGRLEFRLPT